MNYQYSGKTDIGLKRDVNQDSFETAKLSWGSIFVISDGFGHREGGKFASQTAVDIIIKNFSKEEPQDIKQFYDNSFDEINKYIYYKRVSMYDNTMMGCTIVVMIVTDDTTHIGHIGDSRAYIYRNEQLQKLTKDHSYVQSLVDRGEISPENALIHSKRHILRKCLGSRQEAKLDYFLQPIQSNDEYILCCDGVWGTIPHEKFQAILKSNIPEDATTKLIEAVKEDLGSDNITLQIIQFV